MAKGPVPTVYVASGPTELIVTDGAPKFVPIPGTNLVYAGNTTGHLFKHTGNRRTYVLVSGRWFTEASEGGPWEFVPGEQLPDDFAKIPDDSPKENVKASVPGTAQAEEAVISNSIPQSAKVMRSEARLTPPKVDGAPQLAPIDGTSLAYVKNTATPIIQSGAAYYAVENGVWFTTRSVSGPWSVATVIPPEIYSIPPGSPLYYVTFVRVYHSTPDVVYVSDTPGYSGTYVGKAPGTCPAGEAPSGGAWPTTSMRPTTDRHTGGAPMAGNASTATEREASWRAAIGRWS